jgi:pimeloyl-ACP methyl ester carboxylesterase
MAGNLLGTIRLPISLRRSKHRIAALRQFPWLQHPSPIPDHFIQRDLNEAALRRTLRVAGQVPITPEKRRSGKLANRSAKSAPSHVAALPVSAANAAAASTLGDLPLVVLSGDHLAAPYTDWQRDLAQLSSCGRHVVASDSGHWIHLDHPELVTGAIREVVATARSLKRASSNL